MACETRDRDYYNPVVQSKTPLQDHTINLFVFSSFPRIVFCRRFHNKNAAKSFLQRKAQAHPSASAARP